MFCMVCRFSLFDFRWDKTFSKIVSLKWLPGIHTAYVLCSKIHNPDTCALAHFRNCLTFLPTEVKQSCTDQWYDDVRSGDELINHHFTVDAGLFGRFIQFDPICMIDGFSSGSTSQRQESSWISVCFTHGPFFTTYCHALVKLSYLNLEIICRVPRCHQIRFI